MSIMTEADILDLTQVAENFIRCSEASPITGRRGRGIMELIAIRSRYEMLLKAAEEVIKFTEPEWRDDVDRGDADLALAKAVAICKGGKS